MPRPGNGIPFADPYTPASGTFNVTGGITLASGQSARLSLTPYQRVVNADGSASRELIAYLQAIGIIALIYALLALGLNLQFGLTRLVNFGVVAFFAIGAYTSALLSLAGVPLILSFAAATILGVGIALTKRRTNPFGYTNGDYPLVVHSKDWRTWRHHLGTL